MTIDDIHGWFDYQDLYREAIKRVPKNGTLIELGVWCGKSLAFLAQESITAKRDDLRLIGIDLWDYSPGMNLWGGYILTQSYLGGRPIKDVCEDNLKQLGLRHRIELLCYHTIDAAKLFEERSVDFVWFDSNHEPDHVRAEVTSWLPKLKRPTWCGGHDVDSPGLFDAVRAVLPQAVKVPAKPGQFGSWRAELP